MSNSSFYQHGEELYRNWAMGAPDNSNGREACASINGDGVWDDVPCSLTLKSVCSDVNGTNVSFTYISTMMNWSTAQNYCREHHTDLISVRNLAENQDIHRLNPAESLWIGLFRDSWKWSDRTGRWFTYWKKEEPDGAMDCCAAAVFAHYGMWEDWGCAQRIGFICYWDVPVLKREVRLKLVKLSSLDLNDPTVLEDLLKKLQQKLKEQGLNEDMKIRKLSWKKQYDGNVFHKEKEK
ncbi:hypothetical protein CHARACLAT_031638 [Characodon lateralis]|uniref:C-type lectin domain-containing protein n=1 Tax=Characodon lateralis TaxID=208331 RepID=A0ABU7DBM9_9TELE|nr:hypothetical protein [Characodon lateralis]